MRFKDFLQVSASEIDSYLEVFFKKWSSDVDHVSSRFLSYAECLADISKGGKRIRGALVKLPFPLSGKGVVLQ